MIRTLGLTDLQVNGYAGVDFNDAALTADALDHALEMMRAGNVTCCLLTLISADEATLADRLAALDAAVAGSRLGKQMVPGFHLEGPFLNPAAGYAGCHPVAAMIEPDPAVLDRLAKGLRRPILLLTLAPERPGAMRLIASARERGMVVAMGHTAASHAVTAAAADAGVTLSTHLGNALPQPQPKFLNPLMAQLSADRLHATFIADGIHIPPDVLKVLIRAKTPQRSILVSDATAAAGAPVGLYRFADASIEHTHEGVVRIPGTSTLAGSALSLDQAVRNMVAWSLTDFLLGGGDGVGPTEQGAGPCPRPSWHCPPGLRGWLDGRTPPAWGVANFLRIFANNRCDVRRRTSPGLCLGWQLYWRADALIADAARRLETIRLPMAC